MGSRRGLNRLNRKSCLQVGFQTVELLFGCVGSNIGPQNGQWDAAFEVMFQEARQPV